MNEKKILVVDDNVDSLKIQRLIFEQEGYKVNSAETGAACWSELARDKPDLIILDVMLPDTLGTDLCLKIKRDPHYKDIIVILLSGIKITEEDRLMGLEIGAIDYLNRPINRRELIAKVNAVFDLKSALVQPRKEEPYSSLTDNTTSVTAGVFEQQNIWESNPELFEKFKSEYVNIMLKQIDYRMFKKSNNVSEPLRLLALEFGFLKAGPRDIIQVHNAALKSFEKNVSAVKSFYLKEESRILLVELMGYLLMFYRNKS